MCFDAGRGGLRCVCFLWLFMGGGWFFVVMESDRWIGFGGDGGIFVLGCGEEVIVFWEEAGWFDGGGGLRCLGELVGEGAAGSDGHCGIEVGKRGWVGLEKWVDFFFGHQGVVFGCEEGWSCIVFDVFKWIGEQVECFGALFVFGGWDE